MVAPTFLAENSENFCSYQVVFSYQVWCLPCRWNGEVLGAKLMDL
jgi:hypothetical protein